MAAERNINTGTGELTSLDTLKAAFAELVATLLFVLIGVGSIAAFLSSSGQGTALADGIPVIALAHGFAIAMLVAGIGAISGGHINPAVTFAMVITGRVSVIRGVMYVVAQVIGAILGALLLRAFVLDQVLQAIPGGGGDAISPAVGDAWKGMILEALGAFVWVWTFFATTVSRRLGLGNTAPLYIGLAVLVVYLFLIPFTGAGINPARTFGPALALPGAGDGIAGRWSDHWVYWVGPLIGAAVAGLTYYWLYLTDEDL